MILFLQRQF